MGVMQLILIIFILFIIIGIGMFYFYKFSISNVKSTAAETCMQSVSEQLSSVLELPEIKCSVLGHEDDCIDTAKLVVYKESSLVKKLGESGCHKSVKFVQVYPVPEEKDKECTKQTWPDCDTWSLYEPSEKIKKASKFQPLLQTPVSLYYPNTGEYKIGKLELRMYQR